MVNRFSYSACVAAALLLGACGFKPMYAAPEPGVTTPVTETMAAIRIHSIADHDGVKLRQFLREGLQPAGPAQQYLYDLDVQMRAVTQELGVRKDATSSRANRIYTARFALIENGRRIFADQTQAIVSYNIADDQYATVSSVNNASDRAIRQIGEQIKTRIGIFLKSRERAAAAALAAPASAAPAAMP